MRYSESHKQETHAKLVKIAAKMLREKGPDGFAVAELMNEAGLTHGGFYAHFESKEACVAEALREIFAQMGRRTEKNVEGLPPRHALATVIDLYVSPYHRDNAGDGCPVTSLNSDMPRQPHAVREAFDAGVKSMVATMKRPPSPMRMSTTPKISRRPCWPPSWARFRCRAPSATRLCPTNCWLPRATASRRGSA